MVKVQPKPASLILQVLLAFSKTCLGRGFASICKSKELYVLARLGLC